MHVFEKGKFGPFLSCDSYPRCKGAVKLTVRKQVWQTRDHYADSDDYADPDEGLADLFADEHFSCGDR